MLNLKSQMGKELPNRIPHAYCEDKRLSNAINSLREWLPENSLCPENPWVTAISLLIADVLPSMCKDFFPRCSPALDSPVLPRQFEDRSQSVKAEEELSIVFVHGFAKSIMDMRFL